VPFTLAHAAAALPFRRLGVVPSALVVGTFAPDLWYFLGLGTDRGLGHTIHGAFVFTPPLALIVLWIFHALVKPAVISLLPNSVQSRLVSHPGRFRFWGLARLAAIFGSILLGIATHLLWDSFTHPTTWLYHHWTFLSRTVRLPILGLFPYYKAFQHGSTIIGAGVLLLWFVRWYQTTEPCRQNARLLLSAPQKLSLIALVLFIAFLGAGAWLVIVIGAPTHHFAFKQLVGQTIVPVIALLWWEFVAYGLIYSMRLSGRSANHHRIG